MGEDVVKLHAADSPDDAVTVMVALKSANIKYAVSKRGDNGDEGNGIMAYLDMYVEPVDLYVHRDDLLKAEAVLRPLLIK